ncbi:MAG: ribosome maturation factor RimP [Betaproteobacteria bacterium RIFCSPLOWO2_12_FULL_64_23]|nr:MAG: ribosome maturation factor RimP [Betaproteobacteria bacterium RIFCSPLOWO2_12_FULL_64_23]
MELQGLLEATVGGLGYELVDVELSNRGRMLRIFIDKTAGGPQGAGGITVDDCARVSNQLARVLEVEDIDYDRLEVSSPGLDRPLKKEADFARFAGEQARLTLRVPVEGRRNFTGVMRAVALGKLQLEVEGGMVSIDLANVDKARLVPKIEF